MIYYVKHHGKDFTSLNKDYSVGTTIATLEKAEEGAFKYDKIISSPDNPVPDIDSTFWPNENIFVIGYNERDTIEQVFTKKWY